MSLCRFMKRATDVKLMPTTALGLDAAQREANQYGRAWSFQKHAIMNREKYRHLRVGLVGLGLEAYWSQFEGLKERLEGYVSEVAAMIAAPDRVTINLGLVDSPSAALEAGHQCRIQDIDLLLVYATTYALSSTVLPVIARAKVPVLLLNLQPAAALDYERVNRMTSRTAMTGEWLAYCGACPIPEIANVLVRLGIPFHQITGMLHGDQHVRKELDAWLKAAGVAKSLSHSRLGLMGHYYGGMLDIATDLAQVSGRFGVHIEQIEVDELAALRRGASETEVAVKLMEMERFFDVQAGCTGAELDRAARTSVALDAMIDDRHLDMLAYYYKGVGIPENEDALSSIIVGTSMLTASHVAVAGEYEVKNVIAMKILDLLDAGGSFTEYYAMDFDADVVLMGHDGPGHRGVAEDRIKLRPLQVYHGKVGSGLSVEMSVKNGPVTLLSVVESRKTGLMLLAAEGHSVAGPVLEIGNTNSRYQFPLGCRGFVEAWNTHGPAHHCAVGVGHLASLLEKLAKLLELEFHQVC
jgi:L-arabinose isomerase